MPPFSKVLVANRGEIAIRVIRALRELGIGAVAVYSEADRDALHVQLADDAFLLGPGRAAESYLAQERLLETALRAGVDAIHPGYGFLAENPSFARAVEGAGLVWIGPPARAIEAMGAKTAARALMRQAGVPVVPGTTEAVASPAEVARLGDELGWPIAIKATAGGGGKGLRVVRGRDEVERAFAAATREGLAYFADSAVYVEKLIEDPRHVEVQLLADAYGTIVHLGERDCTIQRRHQKLVEESPSPAVTAELRERIGAIAIEAARAVGYQSAGTVEGLLDRDGTYYFLEMNTRVQVEHGVTELVTGVDIVREQILIAAGERLSFAQADVRLRGHAIECRVNAEDPERGFVPTPGVVTRYREPAGPGVRVDSGIAESSEVGGLYDPLLAKVLVWDQDREAARRRMLRALEEFEIEGVATLLDFHRALLTHQCFVEGGTCFGLVESALLAGRARSLARERLQRRAEPGHPPAARRQSRVRTLVAEIEGRRFEVRLAAPEPAFAELARRRRRRGGAGGRANNGGASVVSPMQGTVLSVAVRDGERVVEGQLLCILEAMKMENEITAHREGTVSGLAVTAGDSVTAGQLICVVDAEASGAEGIREG